MANALTMMQVPVIHPEVRRVTHLNFFFVLLLNKRKLDKSQRSRQVPSMIKVKCFDKHVPVIHPKVGRITLFLAGETKSFLTKACWLQLATKIPIMCTLI